MTWLDWFGSTLGMPLWAQFAQAAALIAIAVFGGMIAYRQYRVAQDKLDLDLFEKRWEVYNLALKFCGIVMKDFNPPNGEFRVSWQARERAQFLFGNDVNTRLKEIHDLASSLHAVGTSLSVPNPPNHQHLAERQYELTMQFHALTDNLADVFVPYLTFDLHRRRK